MESVHELAAPQTVGSRAHLELVQATALTTVRCPSCNGLRGVSHIKNSGRLCKDCRKGHIVPRTQFHNYWLTRFSIDEITEMGRAIWG
jgi:hypothetical protein